MSLVVSGVSCQACGKVFSLHKNLLKHFRVKHGPVLPLRGSGKAQPDILQCDVCGYKTSAKNNMERHKKVHVPRDKEGTLFCPLCSPPVKYDRKEVYKHFVSEHNIRLCQEEMEFSSEGEFFSWKAEVERESSCDFPISFKYTTDNNSTKVFMFRCHRDGVFRPRGENVRHLKMRGSVKIGGNCPASMHVRIHKDGKASVSFCKTHVGHMLGEVGRMQLTQKEREEVAQKIASGVPFDIILDNVRKSISDPAYLERQHLLTSKDLHNITRDLNLNNSIIRHSHDLTSVESWIREMQQHGNLIRFYKPQGMELPDYPQLLKDDFVLIIMNEAQVEIFLENAEKGVCMDDTHGMNPYGFLLTTLLVFDELSQGFPSAFMFANRGSLDVMGLFVKFVREAVGSTVKPTFMMTDMADVFYNAWMLHMEKPDFRLYCTWHIDRAWRKNLSKIKGREKQADTYKVLRTLLEESDETAFNGMVEASLELFLNDEDTAEFGRYFEENYVASCTRWAYCHRKHAGVNTNMSLERFHGILKYLYLKGNKPKRLDISLHALMRFLRDKVFDRVIHMQKGKLTHKISALRTRHRSALLLNRDALIQDEGSWKWFSSDCSNIYDIVATEKLKCSCELRCEVCKICIHMYQCSCPDSAQAFNMCKHIHLVQLAKTTTDDCEGETEMDNYSEHLVIHEDPRLNQQKALLKSLIDPNIICREKTDLEEEEERLLDQFRSILKKTRNAEDITLIDKALKSLSITLDSQQCQPSEFKKEKENSDPPSRKKKFEPQRMFICTKKARGTTPSLAVSVPSRKDKESIAMNLLLPRCNSQDGT